MAEETLNLLGADLPEDDVLGMLSLPAPTQTPDLSLVAPLSSAIRQVSSMPSAIPQLGSNWQSMIPLLALAFVSALKPGGTAGFASGLSEGLMTQAKMRQQEEFLRQRLALQQQVAQQRASDQQTQQRQQRIVQGLTLARDTLPKLTDRAAYDRALHAILRDFPEVPRPLVEALYSYTAPDADAHLRAAVEKMIRDPIQQPALTRETVVRWKQGGTDTTTYEITLGDPEVAKRTGIQLAFHPQTKRLLTQVERTKDPTELERVYEGVLASWQARNPSRQVTPEIDAALVLDAKREWETAGRAPREAREPPEPREPPRPVAIQTVNERGEKVTKFVTPEAGLEVPGAPPAAQQNQQGAAKSLINILKDLEWLSARLNTREGLMATVTGPLKKGAGFLNLNVNARDYGQVIDGFKAQLSRLSGEVGVLTEQDARRGASLVPLFTDGRTVAIRKFTRLRRFLAAKFHTAGLSDDIWSLADQEWKPPISPGDSSARISSGRPVIGTIGRDKKSQPWTAPVVQVGQIVRVKGKRLRVTKIHPDGTYEGVVVR